MKMRRSGLTLIEALVVLAIIAILAAILLPVFARAREKAKEIEAAGTFLANPASAPVSITVRKTGRVSFEEKPCATCGDNYGILLAYDGEVLIGFASIYKMGDPGAERRAYSSVFGDLIEYFGSVEAVMKALSINDAGPQGAAEVTEGTPVGDRDAVPVPAAAER